MDANVVVIQGARGVKRSHRVAFECDHDGYGGLRPMIMRGYWGLRKPTLATAQPPQQSRRLSTLKSCLSRRGGDEEAEGRLKGPGTTVRYNEVVQTLWILPLRPVGNDKGLETTYLSEGHSPNWQTYLARRTLSKRESMRKNLESGSLSACVVYARLQNSTIGVEAIRERIVGPNGVLQHPMFRDVAGTLSRPAGPTTIDIKVEHVTNEELLKQAIGAIGATVTGVSIHSTLASWLIFATIFRRNVDHGRVRSRLKLLASKYKKDVEEVFRCKGIVGPYHPDGQGQAVTDAHKDGDWREIHASAATLCQQCPRISTVRAVEGLLVKFKHQVDKLIHA